MLTANSPTRSVRTGGPLPSEDYARKALPSVLTTVDMTGIFLVAIFFISNAATAAAYGATVYIYWIVGAVTFFIPTVVATAQLGVMFPHEGSIYNWTYKALGPYWGFFAGVCWWFPAPIIVVSCAGSIVSYIQGLNGNWLTQPWQQGLAVIVLVILTSFAAMQRTRTILHVVNVGAGLLLLAAALLGLSGLWWVLTGHHPATSFTQQQDWSLNAGNLGGYSLIALAYLGSQVPLNMGGEIRRRIEGEGSKSITRHLFWGMVLVFVGYIVSTSSLLVVLGPDAVTKMGLFSLIAAVDQVFGKMAGNIEAVCIMGFFAIAAVMYNAVFTRILFAGSVDQRLPMALGRLNKHRVPVNAVLFQMFVAIGFALFVFLIAPYVIRFDNPLNLSLDFYNISLAVVVIVWALLTLFFYIDLFALYNRNRAHFLAYRIFPMPVIWVCCLVGTIGCLVTIIDGLYFSWIPSLVPNATWLLVVAGLVLICFILAGLGSMVATSEAAWQGMSRQET